MMAPPSSSAAGRRVLPAALRRPDSLCAIAENPDRRWDFTGTMVEPGCRPQDSWARFTGRSEDAVEGGAPVRGTRPWGS